MRLLVLALLVSGCRTPEKDAAETGEVDTGTVDTSTAGDLDGDGTAAPDDCNDEDGTIHPGATEVCDGADNDCDGLVDDDDPGVTGADTWYADYDFDGYGGDQLTLLACEQPDGYVDNHRDCDDTNDAVHPDADEVCDGADNDCDGTIDLEATDALSWYVDDDGDGYGTSAATETACDPPAGFALHDGDCDDTDPRYNPGALEADCADPNDYNCDGSTGYDDADGDGFAACEDCDDSTADAHADALEVCDGIDNDCDGDIDGDDGSLTGGTIFFGDSDGDGYGGSQYQETTCSAPPGFVANSDDCDDLDAQSHPGASEVCDGADNDCDTDVDEGVGSTWYQDADGDGYGNGSVTETACDAASGFVGNALDCDDFSATTNPASYEVCDGADNDCDGSTDESAINGSTWYVDGDGDGYGSSASTTTACDQPSGYSANDADCDDAAASVNPGVSEICDTLDNNCDGTVDESDATDATTWYIDADGDSFGSPDTSTTACSQPTGYAADATDCDDGNASQNPATTEVCDGVDNNCDGTPDEELSGADALCAATNCAAIYNSRTNAPTNGAYHVDPDGNGSYEAWCDFSTSGGPYTWHSATEPGAYWSFDGSDVSASDVGGYSGTVLGNTLASSTVPYTGFGSSLQSDNNDSGRVDLDSAVPLGSTWTIAFWGRNTSCINNQIPLLFENDNAFIGDLYHAVAFYGGGNNGYLFAIHDSGCTGYINSWRHFVYQDEGGNIRVWVNGAEVSGTNYDTYASMNGNGIRRFMSKPSFGTNGLEGQMDDLAIYDTALSEPEIQRIYTQAANGRPVRWQ